MSNDRELLELAAKAAGYVVRWYDDTLQHGPTFGIEVEPGNPCGFEPWDPLADDGDAFRLFVDINLSVTANSSSIGVGGHTKGGSYVFVHENTSAPRTDELRRVIVRAAAEIGRSMP